MTSRDLELDGFMELASTSSVATYFKYTEDNEQIAILQRVMVMDSIYVKEALLDVHTLVIDRTVENHYGVFRHFFFRGNTIKRFCVLSTIGCLPYVQKEDEIKFYQNLFGLCIDELCVDMYISSNLCEEFMHEIEMCMAKSLHIKITLLRESSTKNQETIDRLLNLKNLSALDIYSPWIADTLTESNIEKILLNRQPKLETVYIYGFYGFNNIMQICSEKILSRRLHSVLLDVSISLSSLGLPMYVLYFMLELLPEMRGHNRYLVIDSLEKIEKSIRKIKPNRFEL